MRELNEALLGAWMCVSTVINNERVSARMPYNMAAILRILMRAEGEDITASTLCERLKMKKSQMNRTLQEMEERGMIVRERATDDRRRVYVRVQDACIAPFMQQHEAVIGYIDGITQALGAEKTGQLIALMEEVLAIIKEKDPKLRYINPTTEEENNETR